jgi:hypothetical protein
MHLSHCEDEFLIICHGGSGMFDLANEFGIKISVKISTENFNLIFICIALIIKAG